MKKYILFIIVAFVSFTTRASSDFSVYRLTCDQAVNPVAIGTEKPCFSWRINAEKRGFEQSAYRILVADSPEKLANDVGNLWDSGKVKETSSILIPYNGKKLQTQKQYYWKVKIWDHSDTPSDWSMNNLFSIGLLSEKDWGKAKWIAFEPDKADEIVPVGIARLVLRLSEIVLDPQFAGKGQKAHRPVGRPVKEGRFVPLFVEQAAQRSEMVMGVG